MRDAVAELDTDEVGVGSFLQLTFPFSLEHFTLLDSTRLFRNRTRLLRKLAMDRTVLVPYLPTYLHTSLNL